MAALRCMLPLGEVILQWFASSATWALRKSSDDQWLRSINIAAQQGHLEVVRFLCDVGAEKIQAMNDGLTPLYIYIYILLLSWTIVKWR